MTISPEQDERSKRESSGSGSRDGAQSAPRAAAEERWPVTLQEARARFVRFHDWFIGAELLGGAPFLHQLMVATPR